MTGPRKPDFPGFRSATIRAMTTIIGLQGLESCVLAADSQTTSETGRPYFHPEVEKITERGEYLIACSGDADACDIIQHVWQPPKAPKKNQYKFMVIEVAKSIRECLDDNEYSIDKDDKDAGFLILIALHGTIYELDHSFNVSLRKDGIYGIGSGSRYAIGALYADATWEQALKIAEINDIHTGAPFISKRQLKI
jgi:ATP-dependent protease HslVU (ClpYQ) peptidase subunit